MKIGLIGLPKTGKTTLFNLLTGSAVATARYDTGRAELHTGVARVPDPRVDRLSALFKPKKTTYASFEVVDLAGIAKGERGGLEIKEFRNADALLHVVRAFPDEVAGLPDPRRDILDLETELILADLEVVDRRLERLEASLRKQRKEVEAKEQEILRRLKADLETEVPLRAMALSREDAKAIRGFTFLSEKPILHCLNLDEKAIGDGSAVEAKYGLRDIAGRPRTRIGWVSAVIETEVAQLAGLEQQAFLADLGLKVARGAARGGVRPLRGRRREPFWAARRGLARPRRRWRPACCSAERSPVPRSARSRPSERSRRALPRAPRRGSRPAASSTDR